MLTSIQKFINKCDKCLKSKYERNPLKLPLSLTETPNKPMEHMFMDLYSSGGTTFLTIIDNFTKYAQAIPVPTANSIHIAEALISIFAVIGTPVKITTNSDPKFDNDVITEICAVHNIHIHFTTPYNPNSNSPVERLHSTLAELIRIQHITDRDEPINRMKYAIIAYNNTIHSVTGFTPFELLYGHTSSRNPLELHCSKEFYQQYVIKHKQIMENVQKLVTSKLNVIEKLNKDKQTAPFKVGDTVYKQVAKTARSNKLEPKYLGPYKIVHIHPEQIAEKQNITPDNSLIIKQTNYLINTIESKIVYLGLETINSKNINRHKRALIGGLGTIIKSITGNLDENDAIQFENEIRTLKATTNNYVNNQKQSLDIMKDFMKAYENDLKHIVTNQLEIARKKDRYSTQQTEFETKIFTFEIFSDIERSLQQLYDRFSTLENAITFSNLGKMHPSIIDPNYLIEQLNYIQNNIDLRLAFDPNMESIHFWEKAITVKAYGTNETLNFILEVPLVTNNPANLLHLYSIPNYNNTILIPKNPTIILGNNEFAYPHEACVEIMDNDVICKHLEWQDLQHSSDCIAQLI